MVEEIVRAIEQPISLARHDEVVLMQSFDLLGPSRQSHNPAEVDVRVIAFFLGKLTDILNEAERFRKLWNRTASGCGGPPAVSYCFSAGAPGSTAATPSGLMLNAANINGSFPGFPHWCTSSPKS